MGAALASLPGLAHLFADKNADLISSPILNVARRHVGEIRPQPECRQALVDALSEVLVS